ncbi:ABC transporter permease [Nocardia puris]|uniref:ABC-2 family transporter n=1 Tax=Nocardia puris TaxID=208602 RepID=A0A366D805_9NOCA|nr:ABC transporter permease [Nocardia puris]MBF6212354.1 ABC transporter permease [Nocardia puris]MBF6366601.1 ABC transporter permease [Nocardia puris]MBF6460943.1 ABC transporter permease [Nocardia puris]RBO85594.1 ABC-2 family transporter [Nocardia puris]
MLATYLARSVRSELTKLSWRNSFWYTVVPLAILIPVLINFGIAKATQEQAFNGSGGMETNNSTYWILIFATFILMSGGVTSLCAEFKDKTVETAFGIQARRWLLPVSKLIVFGAISGVTSLLTTFILVGGFPRLFPDVWGKVDAFSSVGVRLLICVPIFTMLICALGLGLSALLPKPGLVVMIVLLWKFGVEVFVTFVPGDLGIMLQRLSPFKNGELGVGQMSTIKTLFGGPTGSLLYFAALCLAIFVIGTVRLSTGDTKTD